MSSMTVKRLAILVAVLGLIGVIGFFAQRAQVQRLARSVAEKADRVKKEGDLVKAEALLKGYLQNVPDDLDMQFQYANLILEIAETPTRQEMALGMFRRILRRSPGLMKVRRQMMDLLIKMQRYGDAQGQLVILLGREPLESEDGDLQFRLGRCHEEQGDRPNAVKYYHAAIEHNAPQRIEAYQRRAILLRGQLGERDKADKSIEEMVESDPKNYRVYLERGRYRRRFNEMPGAKKDFEESLKLASGEERIDVILEMANVAEKEKESGPDVARKILENELKTTPGSVALNESLAMLELRAGQPEKAIEILHDILKIYPNSIRHGWMLARILVQRGDTRELAVQIEELRRIGFAPTFMRFLRACYNFNKNEFAIARDILVPLQSEIVDNIDLKSQVNLLLGKCYRQLGDPEMEQEAYLETLKANPDDLMARLGWIDILLKRGEIDKAIEEYKGLVSKDPSVRLSLARLLIERTRRQPADKRNWGQVDRLIGDAAAREPDSVEVRILQASSLLAQDKAAEAEKVLETTRAKNPQNVAIWVAQIGLLSMQRRIEEAQKLLDQAQRQLGDQVDLLLAQARLAATKNGPEVIALLNKLAEKIDRFSKPDDQRKLRNGLAVEYFRHQDLQAASDLFSKLAEQFPKDIEVRSKLIELAFKMADDDEAVKNSKQNTDEAEKNIEKIVEQIERIEGSEGLVGGYFRVRSLVWQAARASDKSQRLAKQAKDAESEADRLSLLKASEASHQRAQTLQTEAHQGVNKLMSRRADWSLVHMVLAQLNEQELAQVSLDEQQQQEKLESIINSYLKAVELGQRDPSIVRRVVQLLFKAKRGNEGLELYNRSGVEPQSIDDRVERLASVQAFKRKDFRRAEEITRKAVAARPDDFEEWLWLAQILVASGRQANAELEIRQAIELSKKADPVRWVGLVRFLAATRQPEKAEQAFKEAQTNLRRLGQPMAPLAMAECCEFVGRAHVAAGNADAVQKWYGEAKGWFEKARAARPDDPLLARRFALFFLETKQINEAESHLEAILKSGSSDKTAVAVASWAKRTLALTLVAKGDAEQARKALALFEPTIQSGEASKAPEEAEAKKTWEEDQRVLAKVLDAQKTPEHRKRAIEIVNSLLGENPNNLDDRLLLAQLEELADDWPKARQQYDELIARTENNEEPDILTRRAVYLELFIRGLIRRGQANENQELTRAQELVGKLKTLQPDGLNTLILEVMLNKAQGEFENQAALKQAENQVEKEAALDRAKNHVAKVATLVQAFANRPDLTLRELEALADQVERLNELDLAEKLQHQLAAKAPNSRGTMGLAAFLGRRGRVKEALTVIEPLWPTTREPELLAILSFGVVMRSDSVVVDPADVKKVIDWLTQALKRQPRSTNLMVALANIEERQELYPEAEALYRRAIEQGDRNGISHNNLAWLLALKDGGNLKEALEYVNRAIDLRGPRPDFLDTRGVVYLAKGENQAAITDLVKAVASAPSPSKYFHLAEAYLKDNKKAEAKRTWEVGKIKGWKQSGLHALEQPAYNKVRNELEMP
jgi:cellulose synthase operon protein C